MEGRGRHSAAELAVVQIPGQKKPPEPPEELGPDQAREWRAVVARMPADWFGRETWALLTQYCRHVVSARRVSRLIAAIESGDSVEVQDYDRLLKMHEREGNAISLLATKMRITQLSTYDRKKVKKPGAGARPWDAKPGT